MAAVADTAGFALLNLPEFEAKLAAWGRSVSYKVLDVVIADELEPMRADVERRASAHRRSGRLAGGVVIIRKGPGKIAINLSGQRYGEFKEWGNFKQAPEPVMRPAFDAGVDALVARIGRRLAAFMAAAAA